MVFQPFFINSLKTEICMLFLQSMRHLQGLLSNHLFEGLEMLHQKNMFMMESSFQHWGNLQTPSSGNLFLEAYVTVFQVLVFANGIHIICHFKRNLFFLKLILLERQTVWLFQKNCLILGSSFVSQSVTLYSQSFGKTFTYKTEGKEAYLCRGEERRGMRHLSQQLQRCQCHWSGTASLGNG